MTTSPPPPTTLKPPSPSPSAPSPPPLLLTIRFSAAIPDLELDIPRPALTTVVSLKHLIRQRLEEPNSQRRLRFIHGGKILPDNAVLSSVLRAPLLPPPPRGIDYGDARAGGGGGVGGGEKGNASGKDKEKGKSVPGRPEPPQRIYVNCSIGDSLTTAELEAEASLAAAPPPAPSQSTSPRSRSPLPPPGTPLPSTSAAPRGFDRLLSAGFTAAEVNQLRLQFRSIHASRFTPDTLPSPDSFRRMEDAWIDDNGASMPSTGALGGSNNGGGAGGLSNGTDSDEVGLVALVDVMIRGVMTGFMWPLGSAGWLVREEGMASGRWRFMVGVGVMFSVLIGIIRTISGER
ncbi:DUF2407 C-terminal domain-containing protein [Daldinia bambusicola]|nr:DUF2407 C-terminal domain-containing protein [Daldinia bambusicola]